MDVFGWVVLVGVVAYPLLFAYAYRDFRRGERTRASFRRSSGIGATGFAVLLQQAAERWLATPADDAVAVASLAVLAYGVWAIYRSYTGSNGNGDADADAPARN